MSSYTLHVQEVWNLTDLTTEQKLILNYCWAWKARGNPITVTDSFLCQRFQITHMDLNLIWGVLLGKGYIKTTHSQPGLRIIECMPLNGQKDETPDYDIFEHLY
jgi:hypothetical protein